jgi:hypothetical protein
MDINLKYVILAIILFIVGISFLFKSLPKERTGVTEITNTEYVTEAEYDSLIPNANTLYIIVTEEEKKNLK